MNPETFIAKCRFIRVKEKLWSRQENKYTGTISVVSVVKGLQQAWFQTRGLKLLLEGRDDHRNKKIVRQATKSTVSKGDIESAASHPSSDEGIPVIK